MNKLPAPGRWLNLALIAILAWLFLGTPLGGPGNRLSYDLSMLLHHPPPTNDVLIVYEDSTAVGADGRLDRQKVAALLTNLWGAGAKAVLLDYSFSASAANAADLALSNAFKTFPETVQGVSWNRGTMGQAPGFNRPAPPFMNARFGSMEFLPEEPDRVVRRIPAVRKLTSPVEPLSWIAARSGGGHATAESQELWLNYYGPPGSVPAISWVDALAGNTNIHVSGKVVFVGHGSQDPRRDEGTDLHENPWSRWSGSPNYGVELHATAALNLMHRHCLTRIPWWVEFTGFMVLLGALCWWMFEVRSEHIWLIGGSAMAAIFLVAAVAWTQHVFFSWATMVAIVILATAWIAWINRFHLGGKTDGFISFRTEGLGETAAFLMSESLAGHRKNTFFSTEGLKPGAALTEEIKDAIREAHTFLIIFTPEYCSMLKCKSSWIRMELDFAIKEPLRRSVRAVLVDAWRRLRGKDRSGLGRRRFQVVLVGWPASPTIEYPPDFEWISELKGQVVLTVNSVGAVKDPKLEYENFRILVHMLANEMRQAGQDLDAMQKEALCKLAASRKTPVDL